LEEKKNIISELEKGLKKGKVPIMIIYLYLNYIILLKKKKIIRIFEFSDLMVKILSVGVRCNENLYDKIF
jgi:hypothetical protein